MALVIDAWRMLCRRAPYVPDPSIDGTSDERLEGCRRAPYVPDPSTDGATSSCLGGYTVPLCTAYRQLLSAQYLTAAREKTDTSPVVSRSCPSPPRGFAQTKRKQVGSR